MRNAGMSGEAGEEGVTIFMGTVGDHQGLYKESQCTGKGQLDSNQYHQSDTCRI